MKLSDEEYAEFLPIYMFLILYAGQETGILDPDMDIDIFTYTSPQEKLPARNVIFEMPEIIDRFISENPFSLMKEELDIAAGFKNFIKGQFFLVKYLKKYTIFLQDDRAYGVWSLFDSLKNMFLNTSPLLVEAVLLPYRGKIVYDGIILSSNIQFGRGYRTSINQQYNEAKAVHGIITTLPFEKSSMSQEEDHAAKLDFYMKSANNRSYYEYEINDLLDRHPELEGRYYWNWGRIKSRQKKKWLKELGISGLHYAIVSDTIIAQGDSTRQIKEIAQAMLPPSKHDWIFYFEVK